MVTMDRFTSSTHLMPLKDAATSQKIFAKLNCTILDVHSLPLSIVLDHDSRFTSKVWSQMMKSLGIKSWMATQYHHQTNGQVERMIRTLKQLMMNFVNPRQNNWSGARPPIAAAMNGAPHQSLGISPYHALYGCPEFVTGRGGAGFHSPGPTLTTGQGGYFGGDPRPAPVRGESPLIPWT